jgi:hypothetical protein
VSHLNSVTRPSELAPSSPLLPSLTFLEQKPPTNLQLYLDWDQNSLRVARETVHVKDLLETPDTYRAAIFDESRGPES